MPIPRQYTERLERAANPLKEEVYGNLYEPTSEDLEATTRLVLGRGLLVMHDIISSSDSDDKDKVAAVNAVVSIGKYNEATRTTDKNKRRMLLFGTDYLIGGDDTEEPLPALPAPAEAPHRL